MSSCVSCGNALRFLRRYDFKSDTFRKVYRDRNVYSCVACGLHQVDVSKVHEPELMQYYRNEYRAIARLGVGESGHQWYRARASALAQLAAEHLTRSPTRAFEVGAGYGYNLSALKETFPAVLAFTDELDESIKLPAIIERCQLSDGGYDVVILSHVLEHFTHPKRLIASAINALTNDGIVVIEVPNDVPGIFPINGPDEPHLTFFTAATLASLLGTTAVYAAGPPYQRKTIRRSARRLAARILTSMPVLSKLVARRRMRLISSESLAVKRFDGVFLRAVLFNRP